MDGTTEAEREAQRREPSPLVGEVEGRLRDIVQNGAEPWNDPAEIRRATRRRDMEIMRLSAMEAALHTTEYICGRLPAWKREPFEKVTDPIASLANLKPRHRPDHIGLGPVRRKRRGPRRTDQ